MKNVSLLLARAGVVVAATAVTAVPAFAAGTEPDFSGIYAGIGVAGLVAAMVAQGGLKALPNFAKWGANKVAGFFR